MDEKIGYIRSIRLDDNRDVIFRKSLERYIKCKKNKIIIYCSSNREAREIFRLKGEWITRVAKSTSLFNSMENKLNRCRNGEKVRILFKGKFYDLKFSEENQIPGKVKIKGNNFVVCGISLTNKVIKSIIVKKFKNRIRRLLDKFLPEMIKEFNYKPKGIEIKITKNTWASILGRRNTLMMSTKTATMPTNLFKIELIHEFVHTLPNTENHGLEFRKEMEKRCPNGEKEVDKWRNKTQSNDEKTISHNDYLKYEIKTKLEV